MAISSSPSRMSSLRSAVVLTSLLTLLGLVNIISGHFATGRPIRFTEWSNSDYPCVAVRRGNIELANEERGNVVLVCAINARHRISLRYLFLELPSESDVMSNE